MAPKNIAAYGLPCCITLMIMLLAILHFYGLPHIIYKAEMPNPNIAHPILLPNMEPSDTTLLMFIDYEPPQQTRFQVFGAGCINGIIMNNQGVPFDGKSRCDYITGMTIDFAPFLVQGENVLFINTDRADGFQIGPLLFNRDRWQLTDWLGLALTGLASVAITLLLYCYTGEAISGGILAAGMCMYVYQFSQTSFMQYTMDMPYHLQYITYIANHWRLPAPSLSREYYHPPLYYFLEALVLRFVNWLGSFDTVSTLQFFSLSCFMAFLVFGALILHRLIRHRLAYYTALMLMTLYPSGIMFAARIDSDLLFYALCAACLHFLLRWLEEPKDRYLAAILASLGLTLATRINALILFPLIGMAGIYQWRRKKWPAIHYRSKAVLMGIISVVLGLGVSLGRTFYYHYAGNTHNSLLVSNTGFLPETLAVTSSWRHFFFLDLKAYLGNPFWSVWTDDMGRQYFWNSMLKSSLFGEFPWNQGAIAEVLSILLLAFILYIFISAIIFRREIRRQSEWWCCIALLFTFVAALMVFRWLYPLACSQDFRYIYPALIGFCGLFGLAIEHCLARRLYILAGLGIVLAMAFSAGSALFFLAQ